MNEINPADAQREASEMWRRRPYIPKGSDQQGHTPEAAHAASEITDDKVGAMTWAEVIGAAAAVALICCGYVLEMLRRHAPLLFVLAGFGLLAAVHFWRA